MRIACLAWGSLVWDPRTLPLAGPWRLEGPRLPVEFSRVSLDGRVTLVLDGSAPASPTYCGPLAIGDLDEAVEALAERERIVAAQRRRFVGALVRRDGRRATSARCEGQGETDPELVSAIASWLETRPLDAVLWTALPSRGPAGAAAKRPGFDRLLAHLESLEGEARARAEEYVRRAPRPVRTPHRAQFETRLGWWPRD
jgi:hypothetical protein